MTCGVLNANILLGFEDSVENEASSPQSVGLDDGPSVLHILLDLLLEVRGRWIDLENLQEGDEEYEYWDFKEFSLTTSKAWSREHLLSSLNRLSWCWSISSLEVI